MGQGKYSPDDVGKFSAADVEAPPTSSASWFTPPPEKHGYLYEGAAGILRGLKNATVGAVQSALPRDAAEREYYRQTGGYWLNPLAPVGNFISHNTNDFIEALQRAKSARDESAAQGENWAGKTLATLENYPIIGELVKKAEKAGPGFAKFTPDTMGAVTEGATYAALPEATKRALKVANKAATNTPDAVRVLAQEQAGAGREPVMIAKAQREAVIAERQVAHEAKVAEAQAKYEAQTEAMKQGYSESYAAKNRAKLAQSRLETTKTSFEVQADRLAKEAFDNILNSERAENASLNQRWNEFKNQPVGETSLGEVPSDVSPVANAVLDAQENILKGSKENIGIFRNVLGKINDYVDAAEAPGGMKAAPTNIPLSDLRGFYSEINQQMFGINRKMMPDVYAALKSVRNSLDKAITDTIEKNAGKGAVKDYNLLKEDYTDYMRTWQDTNMSPLAKVVKLGKSPVTTQMGVPVYREAASILTRATGERAPYLMARKAAFGGDAATVAKLRAVTDQLSKLSAKSLKYEVPSEAGGILRRLSELEKPKFPNKPDVKPVELPPEIDPVALRRRKLIEQSAHPFRWWEAVVPTYLIEHLALKSPAIREWIATQSRNELPVQKIR